MSAPALQRGFESHIHYSRGVLRVCEDLYQLDACSRVLIIAFGGLAHPMSALLAAQLGTIASGIISTPQIAGQPQLAGFRYFCGSHPFPNEESARAAEATLKAVSTLDSRALVMYLISAGSSFLEMPEDKEVPIEDLAAVYKVISESPLSSDETKTILKHLSAVKGGRLAVAAGNHQAQQLSILACDGKNVSPDSLACAPTLPDATSTEDCYGIASRYKLVERFPESIRELFTRRALSETPDKDHPAFHNCRWWPIIDAKEKE